MNAQHSIKGTHPDYQLQACRNLEQEFTRRGDRESVRHFQQRIRHIEKSKTGGAK